MLSAPAFTDTPPRPWTNTAKSSSEFGVASMMRLSFTASAGLMMGRFTYIHQSSPVIHGHFSTWSTSEPSIARLLLKPMSTPRMAVPMSVTARMPITTPSAVSAERSLFARICASAIRIDSVSS